MLNEFLTLADMDQKEIKSDSLYITGSIVNGRPCDSQKTPHHIAKLMVYALGKIEPTMSVFEPCAGQGGVLTALSDSYINSGGNVFNHNTYFNEINPEKAETLEYKFPQFKKIKKPMVPYTYHESNYFNRATLVVDSTVIQEKFDRIIMNPPFDRAVNFVSSMLGKLNSGGVLVTLFPTFYLTRLTSHSEFILQLLSHDISINHIPTKDFDCGYGAKISLITITNP